MRGIHKYSLVILILVMSVLTSSKISYSTNFDSEALTKIHFFKSVIDKLIMLKLDSTFIYKILQDERTCFDEKYVKINVTGFLKMNDYSSNYNKKSVSKSLDFINKNYEKLCLAEEKYGVPKEVITSILWVETKHGEYLGNHHVASVYFSTAMCEQPEYIKMNKIELRKNFEGTPEELIELDKKIELRASKKTQWAIEQILALEKIDKYSPIPAVELIGSWAGAFGLSQFIPSSMISWGADGNGDGKINLYEIDDAIFSVANYLKNNGWKDNYDSQRKAVYHYNNLNAYVDAVLILSNKLSVKSDSLNAQINH